MLLIFALRRVRTASGSRWAMLIVMLFTGLPFYVVPISGLPVVAARSPAWSSASPRSVADLLVFLPQPSQQYFRDCRDATRRRSCAASRGRGLFGPRRQRPGWPSGRTRPPRRAPPRTPAPRPRVPPRRQPDDRRRKAKAKVRSDAEAIAKGAELARSRAKASKSRRTSE